MDRASLSWVQAEICDCLMQARHSLEEYAEGSGEVERIRDCSSVLHEIRGVLEMLEFHGVSLLMDEMEMLSERLVEQRIERRDEACEVLMRAIAQLPEYIEYVRTGHRDNPLLLMPLLNDMRSIRGDTLLSESALFSPELWGPLPMFPGADEAPDNEKLRTEVRRIRPFFQRGLVGWFRGVEAKEGFDLVAAVIFRMARLSGPTEARRLWWVAAGVATSLKRRELQSSTALKRLLGNLDRELKRLIEGGQAALSTRPPAELLKNLLYYIALARSESKQHQAIRQTFGLDGLLVDVEERDQAQRYISGPSQEALRTVGDALREDLSRVKDSLDTFVRNEGQPVTELTPQSEILNRVADTLGLLSLGGPRRAILNQSAALHRFRDEGVPPSHDELLGVARVLLNVDSTLDTLAEHGLEQTVQSASVFEEESQGGTQLTGIEYLQLLTAVISECKADLASVKDAISTFILEPDDYDRLMEIPQRLHRVEGSLEILSLGRARQLLTHWRNFVRATFIDRKEVPDPEMLDTLAETVISIEYYLESVSQARSDSEEILDRAQAGVSRLVEATPEAMRDARPAGDDAPTDVDDSDVEAPEAPAIPSFLLEDLQRAKDLLARIDEPGEGAAVAIEPGSGAAPDSDLAAKVGALDALSFETIDVPVHDGSTLDVEADADVNAEARIDTGIDTGIDRGLDAGADAGLEITMADADATAEVGGAGDAPRVPDDGLSLTVDDDAAPVDGALPGPGEPTGEVDVQVPGEGLTSTSTHEPRLALTDGVMMPVPPADPEQGAPPTGLEPLTFDVTEPAAVQPPPRAPVSRGPSSPITQDYNSETDTDGPEIDEEIIEIFLEETEQVQESLAEDLPAWEARPDDDKRLIGVRRAFHTLKGSGRIVGAEAVADFAWAIESMLNRVIDRVVPASPAIIALTRDAFDALPPLVAAFSGEGSTTPDVSELIARAEELGRPSAHPEPDDPPPMRSDEQMPTGSTGASILAFPSRQEASATETRPDLGVIFAEEANGHLDALEALLNDSEGSPAQRASSMHAPLMRIFHTLHGGARAASMADVAAVAGGLEDYLFGLVQEAEGSVPQPLGEVGVTLVRDCYDALRTAIDEARTGGNGAVRDVDALLLRIAQLSDDGSATQTSQTAEISPELRVARERLIETMLGAEDEHTTTAWETLSDSERSELRTLFLDEAVDLVEAAESSLARWKDTPDDMQLVGSIQRDLHTLKGGARLAGMQTVGDLAHAMESIFMMVGERVVPANERLFDILLRSNDRLATVLDRASNGEVLPDVDELIDELDRFVSPGISDDAVAPTVESVGATTELSGEATRVIKEEVAGRQRLTVSAELLDEIVSHAGEISITHGRIERFVTQVKTNLEEMVQTVDRLRDQLRRLEIETESQILYRYRDETEESEEEFDPLELDRFSNIQELSRALSESVGDLSSIQALLDEQTRDSEALLAQQARSSADLQQGLMQTRMLPFSRQASRFSRIVRETGREVGKPVVLEIRGEETQLDRSILGRMRAPLEHMLRNAVDHGIEAPAERDAKGKSPEGHILLSLYRDGHEVVIDVTDDGQGMNREAIREAAINRGLLHPDSVLGDDELFQFVLEPALSTASGVTQISGRGVGMDVVNTEIKELGGTLQIRSEVGVGTTFTVRLPFTLAINQALMVEVATEVFALPLMNVEAVVRSRAEEIDDLLAVDNPVFEHAGLLYPFVPLTRILGLAEEQPTRDTPQVPVILLRSGEERLALLVEDLSGRHEVVVKPVGRQLASIQWITGATILGDGRVVLVLDVATLVRIGTSPQPASEPLLPEVLDEPAPAHTIMVVDDSITVRRVTDRFLTRNGMRVVSAKDGLEALSLLQEDLPDLMLLDIEMPRMDGFELATTLRNDTRTVGLPIIMITSRTGKKHTDRARQIGVDRYLGKPYHEGELLESINELLTESAG